jgi:glycosyltransferase involved in cell wall biosynthesis
LKLVLIGPTMHSWGLIEEAIAARSLAGWVVLLGHVSEAALSALYGRSTGLIFPSLFEGFGLPVLEAMSAGCPVAVSNAGSLPELIGDAGRTFSPHEIEEIAAALEWLVCLSPTARAQESVAGCQRASQFSVQRLIEGTRAVYEGLF